jgi:hypothetical protein
MFALSVRNEWAAVLGGIELLPPAFRDGRSLKHCKQIKTAVLNVHELLKEFQTIAA